MAERFGFRTIKDAIVTLLGTTAVSDLNSGLARSVQQIVTVKPTDNNMVIPTTKYPTVCVWFDNATEEFEGASKRKKTTALYQIHFWTYSMGSVDSSLDQAQLLADNIIYVLNSNIGISSLGSTRGYLKVIGMSFSYSTNDSGFVTHGQIDLQIIRIAN